MTLKRAKPEARTVELFAVVALKHDPLVVDRLNPVAQTVQAVLEHVLQLAEQAVQFAGVAKNPVPD